MITNPDGVSNATIQTYTGEMFDMFLVDRAKINVEDIAHALSMLCRYGGHSHEFYSVAEHSVLMSRYFEALGDNDLARAALLHDATEAYMGDLVRPIKLQMPRYQEVEANLQFAIFNRFGLTWDMPLAIKNADLRICNDERLVLMKQREWIIDHLEPLGIELRLWYPDEAKRHFLDSFHALFA